MKELKKNVKPFGARFFQELRIGDVNRMKNWRWMPRSKDVVNLLKETASLPSTTGTGPKASSDERQEEM